MSECKNCSVCEKIIEVQKHNDINILLSQVEQWDIPDINQYKHITKFDCIVCNFKTNLFTDWKCHIMSVSHMADCHKIKDLYSYVCSSKNCKVLLYGPEKCLLKHKKDIHSETNGITRIQIIMAEVWKHFINKLEPLHFCSHCKKFGKETIHTKDEVIKMGLKKLINYYCKFCRVTFLSSPEMLDYHSLSVEHMTIKCFDELCTKAKTNSKKIKISEHILLPPTHESVLNTNLIHLPNIVLNRFHNINQCYGECKFCSNSINWNSKQVRLHLLKCEYGFNMTGANKTKITTFKCNVCNFSTNDISGHKTHIITLLHLTNCYDTKNYYSYFCNICNIYMYSDIIAIKEHVKKIHKNTNTTEFLMLSSFMALMFQESNENPNKKVLKHYGNKKKYKVSQNCLACKVKFYTSIEEYQMHEITSEHIILKFLTTEVVLKNENNLTTQSYTKSIKIDPIQDIPLFQNVQNKNQTSDDSCAEFENVVEKVKKLLTTSVCVEELDNDIQSISYKSNNNIELMSKSDHSKIQYTKYYEHKMNLLNLLRQYRDRIIETSSFYCVVCDFITEEKYMWDKHNKTKHPDADNRCTIYCSTCSMLITCKNNEEHSGTTEHCVFMKYLQSLECVEEDIVKKTMLKDFVKNTLNGTSVIKSSKKLELNNTNSTDGSLECQYTTNKSCKQNNSLIKKKKIENVDNLVVTTTSSLLDNNEHENNTRNINFTTSNISNMDKLICTELTSSTQNNSLANLLLTNACKPNENIMNMQKAIKQVDMSTYTDEMTEDSKLIEKEKTNDIDDDGAYGNYVTQRLQMIENTIIKDNIKLEIDNIFYTKIKQMSSNTSY